MENPFGQRCFLCCNVGAVGYVSPLDDKCRLRMVLGGTVSVCCVGPVLLILWSPFPILFLSRSFHCQRYPLISSATINQSTTLFQSVQQKIHVVSDMPARQRLRSTSTAALDIPVTCRAVPPLATLLSLSLPRASGTVCLPMSHRPRRC